MISARTVVQATHLSVSGAGNAPERFTRATIAKRLVCFGTYPQPGKACLLSCERAQVGGRSAKARHQTGVRIGR
jgi:hypothetical protein